MKSLSVVLLALSSVVLLSGCPDTGIVCSAGTVRCGQGCAQFDSDAKNCGSCGSSCRSGQVCQSSSCVCGPGTFSCDGECVVRETDAKNCGQCGVKCAANNVCENGACKLSCPIGASSICGTGCADLKSDPMNCGACGTACAATQVCQASDAGVGTCQGTCTAPNTQCGMSCVDLKSNNANCGMCGKACLSIELCNNNVCVTNCPAATPTRCGNACFDTMTSTANCGACGQACENSQTCRAGKCTYDLVAACFSSGQVVGLEQRSEFRGPVEPLGTAPQSLATLEGVLLSLDGIDQQLHQAQLKSVGGHAFAKLLPSNATGNSPNQVVTQAPFAYVANSGSGSLQILRSFGAALPDGGLVSDGGLALATIAELPLGANTYPQGIVRVGDGLWIPLYGGFGATAAAAGQKVVRIDVTNPNAPMLSDTVDLSTLDLKPFDGGTPVARPYAIIAHRGAVYVALNNLNPDTYAPEGPGLLAKINVTTKVVTVIDLGADKCLNPGWLASDGTNLLVSCIGAAVYGGAPNFALVRTDKSGVVMLNQNDVRVATWEPRCPAAADGGAGCTPILPSRFAVTAGRAYVGDQNGGRIFVLDIDGGTLGERRGYFGDAGAAISACTPDPVTGIANVSDVLVVP